MHPVRFHPYTPLQLANNVEEEVVVEEAEVAVVEVALHSDLQLLWM